MKKQIILIAAILFLGFSAFSQHDASDRLLLKNFHPVSICIRIRMR